MELFDTHAHLDFPHYKKDRKSVIARAGEAGVKYIVNVGADLTSSQRSLKLSRDYPDIYATVGIHPHDADQVDERALKVLKDLADSERVVAVGEIGLDYYYDNSPRETQREALRLQLRLAREVELPVVIHSREADGEILEILEDEKAEEIGGIFHCFGSDLEMAHRCLDMGFYLAFGGVITFKNAGEVREVVREVQLERVLIETDAPYLTPHPNRGKRNEPAYVRFVAEKIAELRDISLSTVAEITTANARKAYNIE